MRERALSVSTPVGDLRALVHYPDADGPLPGVVLPGVVLVDGGGDSLADGWGDQPATFGGCGAVTLTHDKPGCGGSPGHWEDQSLQDRARDSLAALELLRRQPGVDPDRLGFLGISQGGWVSYIAASQAPRAVSQVVTISGPGVTGVEQERYRIGRDVDGDEEALGWVDERARRILAGEAPASILASQQAYADRPWYGPVSDHYTLESIPFFTRAAAFDPASVLPDVRCPVFAAFGGADTSVPVRRSVAVLNDLLPADPRHSITVFSNADHGLMPAGCDRTLPYGERIAPGFLDMLTAWFAAG
jgi:dienelactone hydrolase